MTARHIRVLLMTAAFAAGLVLCFGIVLIVTGRLSTPVAQQVAAIGGPFKLTDQNGKVVTDQDLKGHPFLVFFGFTNCPDVCPTALFEMSEILRALGLISCATIRPGPPPSSWCWRFANRWLSSRCWCRPGARWWRSAR